MRISPGTRAHVPLARLLRRAQLEPLEDSRSAAPVDLTAPVRGGVKPLASAGRMRLSCLRRSAARCGAARSADPGHRSARSRHAAAQGARAGVDQARRLVQPQRHRRAGAPADHSRFGGGGDGITSIADSCRWNCSRPCDARASGSSCSIEALLKLEIVRAPFTIDELEARRDVDHRRWQFPDAHRSHRRDRRWRLRHPRLQVGRATLACAGTAKNSAIRNCSPTCWPNTGAMCRHWPMCRSPAGGRASSARCRATGCCRR